MLWSQVAYTSSFIFSIQITSAIVLFSDLMWILGHKSIFSWNKALLGFLWVSLHLRSLSVLWTFSNTTSSSWWAQGIFSLVWEGSPVLSGDIMKSDLVFTIQLAWEQSILGRRRVLVKIEKGVQRPENTLKGRSAMDTEKGVTVRTKAFAVATWGLGSSYMPILLSHSSSDSDTWSLMAQCTFSSIHGVGQLYPHEVLLYFYRLF